MIRLEKFIMCVFFVQRIMKFDRTVYRSNISSQTAAINAYVLWPPVIL